MYSYFTPTNPLSRRQTIFVSSPVVLGYNTKDGLSFPTAGEAAGVHRIYMAMGRTRSCSPIQVYILDSSHMCVTTRLPTSLSELKLQLSRQLSQIEMRDDHDRTLVGGRPCRKAQAIQWNASNLTGLSPLNDFDFYVMPQEDALTALRWSRNRLGRSSVFFLNRSTKMRWSKGLHFGQFIAQDHLGHLMAPRRVLEATDLRTIDFAQNVLIARPRERQLLQLPRLAKRPSKRVCFKKDLEEWLICDPNDGSVPLVFRPLRQQTLLEGDDDNAPPSICDQSLPSLLLPLPPWASRPNESFEELTFYEIQFGDNFPNAGGAWSPPEPHQIIAAPVASSTSCH